MTLTEEQREAIHAVSGLLTAVGCPQCHYYIRKNYTHHIEVLRAMVDSSDHIVEPDELIGFDLEKVREAVHTLENFAFASGKITAGQIQDVLWGARLLAASAAEIERLRANEKSLSAVLDRQVQEQAARIKSLKKEIRRLKHESKVEQEFTNSYIKRLHDAEARIKELGSSLDEAEALTKKNAELMNAYLARIAELEDALVEERAGAIRCEFYDHCEIDLPDAMIRARQELQADGKIGPDAKPRSWQITKEEKRALSIILEYISYDADDDIEICSHAAVLRAMLREAE